MDTKRKYILVVYHSLGDTMQRMAERFAAGAAKEKSMKTVLKRAADA